MHSRQKGQEQMGKLAEIKDMEQADSNQSKEFEKFAESQKEHNRVMEKLMKMTAGCAVGALAVVVVAVLAIVPRTASVLGSAGQISSQLEQMLPQAKQTLEDAANHRAGEKQQSAAAAGQPQTSFPSRVRSRWRRVCRRSRRRWMCWKKSTSKRSTKPLITWARRSAHWQSCLEENKRWIIQVKTFMCRPSIFLKAGTS